MMSSAEQVIEAFSQKLPLIVLGADWNDPTLTLKGAGWSISIMTPWRFVLGDRLVLGCDDATQSKVKETVHDKAIVACEVQTPRSPLDPALLFDGGLALEIFSVNYLEPWTLSLTEKGLFIASPAD